MIALLILGNGELCERVEGSLQGLDRLGNSTCRVTLTVS